MPINFIKFIFLVQIFNLAASPLAAQQWCGTPALNESEKQILKNAIEVNSTDKNARKTQKYSINIRPKIIHASDEVIRFSEAQLIDAINEANRVFDAVNIKFVIVDNKIEHIFNDNFYDIKLKDENLLRKTYDNTDGINIYFTHSITSNELSTLNGFARLPNLGNNSNIIILSYLENSASSNEILKNKIFPHELGHYFGLLHTYENSNNENILERELVTRGAGSNCSTKGDQICDTNADPFEIMPSIFSLGCNESLPSTLYDFYGDKFSPPIGNIMSYQNKCGNYFTQQQYQRIENSLNIRLSPNAEYNLTGNSSNFISITELNSNSFCPGNEIIINFEASGSFDVKNDFKVELSDENGLNFREIKNFTLLSKNQIKITIGSELPSGKNYRLSISSTLPATQSPISESFEIKSLPTAEISTSNNLINLGKSTSIFIKFGGSGPWNFIDWDGQIYENVGYETIFFNVKPTQNSLYGISKISNSCGTLNQKPSVLITVAQPTLTIEGEQNRTYCEYEQVNLTITSKTGSTLKDDYQIQITGEGKEIVVIPKIDGNNVSFSLPIQLKREQVYAMGLIGKTIGDFSSEIKFTIKEPPTQPQIISPYYVCFGESNKFLKASGKNLKWYNANNELSGKDSLLIATNTPLKTYYYVSQSDEFGCEGLKSKVEVIISEPVQATISGSRTIMPDSNTSLTIQFKGLPPFEAEVTNYGLVNTFDSLIIINVTPKIQTEYKILSVNNRCGTGQPFGVALINVALPLSIFPEINKEYKPILYPNPVSGEHIFLMANTEKNIDYEIYDLNGKILFKSYSTEFNNEMKIPHSISNGKYIIKVKSKNLSYSQNILIER